MNHLITERRYMLLLVAIAALGAGFVLLRGATYGVGLNLESLKYGSVARSLLAGEGWVGHTGESGDVYTYSPPLYPILLAAPGLLGFDPLAAAGPLNALLFGLTIFVAGHWLRQRIASRLLALWGCLAVALALHLTTVASFALSEPAFILFVTLALFYMDRYLLDGKRASLIWAALFVALACQTRYFGLFLFIALPPLLLLRPGLPLSEKLKHGTVFVLITAIPLGLWLMSNLLRTGSLVRPYSAPVPTITLHRMLNVLFIELAEWILPHPLADEGQWYAVAPGVTALGVAALFALAAAIGFALVRAYRKPETWRSWSSFCLHGSFALVYPSVIVIIIALDVLWFVIGWGHRRYWAPGYIPLLFALVFLLDRFLIWLRQRPQAGSAVRRPVIGTFVRGGAVILGILLFIWFGNNVRLNALAVIRANDSQAGNLDKGYAAPAWWDNDVIHFIREEQLEGTIITRRTANMYFHTDPTKINAVYLPLSLEKLEQRIKQAVAVGDTYLVFFNDTIPVTPSPRSYGLPELEAMLELERVAQLDSGVIFRVTGWRNGD